MRKDRAAKPSIASHRFFPVIVVTWFAALFGLASLTIRPAVMEKYVAATGLDKLLPMTAAPLGDTARLLIILAMTVLGCIVGAIVARITSKPSAQTATRQTRTASRPETAQISEQADDEIAIAAESFETEEDEELARRRRQLAVRPHDEADDAPRAPAEAQILSVTELPLKSFDEVDGIWLHSSDSKDAQPPVKMAVADENPASTLLAPAVVPVEAQHIETLHIDDLLDSAEAPKPALQGTPEVEVAEQDPAFRAEIASTSLIHDTSDGNEDEVEEPRNGILDAYVSRVNANAGAIGPQEAPAPSFTSVPPTAAEDQAAVQTAKKPAPATEFTYANSADRITSAPLEALSHVELLARLAQAIARHQAPRGLRRKTPAATELSELLENEPKGGFASASPQDVGNETAAASPVKPDLAQASLAQPSLVQRSISAPKGTSSNIQTADNDILISGFSALRDVIMQEAKNSGGHNDGHKTSPAQSPVLAFSDTQNSAHSRDSDRHEGSSLRKIAPGTDQTEQALQAALATLRRMSGAA